MKSNRQSSVKSQIRMTQFESFCEQHNVHFAMGANSSEVIAVKQLFEECNNIIIAYEAANDFEKLNIERGYRLALQKLEDVISRVEAENQRLANVERAKKDAVQQKLEAFRAAAKKSKLPELLAEVTQEYDRILTEGQRYDGFTREAAHVLSTVKRNYNMGYLEKLFLPHVVEE